MMQQWNCNNNNVMGTNMAQPVVCPTQYRVQDTFTPRVVPYIHPIVNINRQNTVEVPRHFYTETTRNVMGQTLPAQPGMGPGMGPMGVGPANMGPGMGPMGPMGMGPQHMGPGGWGPQNMGPKKGSCCRPWR